MPKDEKDKKSPVEGQEPPVDKKEGEEQGHDDAAQDAELVKSMLKKHGLIGDDEEPSEEAHAMAKEMLQAMKEMGYSEEECDEGFKHGMKIAKHLGGKKAETEESEESEESESEESESEEADPNLPEHTSHGKVKTLMESQAEVKKLTKEVISLKGQIAKFQESEKKAAFEKHKETVLSNSKLPRSVSKVFLESIGEVKSVEQFDGAFKVFMEGYKSKSGEALSFTIPEKTTAPEKTDDKKGGGFADCMN